MMAQLDPSIYNALLKPVRSVQDYRADMDARDMNALELQGKRLQMQQTQQGMERQNALRGYLSGGNITADGIARFDPKLAMDWTETQSKVTHQAADTQLKGAQTQASQLEAARKKIDMTLQVLSGARDQQSYAQGVQMLQANGIDTSTIPPQFDPAFVQTAAQQALSVKERLDALDASERRKLTANQQAETARHNVASERLSAGNLAVAQGNLGLSRQRLEHDKTAPRGQIVQSDQGVMLVDPREGTSKPVVGPGGTPLGPKLKDVPGPMQKAMIENVTNLQRAERALALVEGKDIGTMKGDKNATGWKGFLPNTVLNRVDPDGVDARASISDLGSLVIHDRSGAAVTAAEFPRLAPFIPQATDDAETVKKKLKRFVQTYKEEIDNTKSMYGPDSGFKPFGGSSAPAAPTAAPAGKVKFLGFE
jgi:hypothetical protein